MPGWLEVLARPFSWLGAWIRITALTTVAVVLLAHERKWIDVRFVLVAVVGSSIAVLKASFDRPQPDARSPIPLPDAAAFPSGQATSGIAALGAFTVLAAERVERRRTRTGIWVGGLRSVSPAASHGSRSTSTT